MDLPAEFPLAAPWDGGMKLATGTFVPTPEDPSRFVATVREESRAS